MKAVCLHNYHHNGFVVHIGCTNEPKIVQQALGKEHNLSGGHVSYAIHNIQTAQIVQK